jgi:hypothetical protein
VEKTVTVHNEGEPSQFVVVSLTVFFKPWNTVEQSTEFTFFVNDDANPLDVIGNGEFTYSHA